MLKNTLAYFDFGYYLRFAALFFLFYLTYTFVVSVAAPSGTYLPFVEKYLNFPALIRYSVLHLSQFLLSLLSYATIIDGAQIKSEDGLNILEMAFPCYGLGLKSFWVAFICAHKMSYKQKLNWSLLGILTIFFLNCLRVTLMMISMVDKWSIADYLGTNAHDLFNYLCYAALFALILLFYSKVKNNHQSQNTLISTKA